MTVQKVYKSQIQNEAAFRNDVQHHINELHKFAFTKNMPRPTAHPLVEASIKRMQAKGQADKYVANYEVVDDTVTPPEVPLVQKKDLCVHRLRMAEAQAREKLVPQRKIRLMQHRWNDALKVPEADRTAAHLAIVEEYKAITEAFGKIDRIGAEAEAAIEDLPEANIDSWTPPTFE